MHPSVFTQSQTREIIDFVKNQYGDELEFLWPKFDDNAIWRNPVTKKWYAAILKVEKSKLINSKNILCDAKISPTTDEVVEILDLRFDKDQALDFALSTPNIYPGWHMNKQSWITIILDGSLTTPEIENFLDHSYQLVSNKQ